MNRVSSTTSTTRSEPRLLPATFTTAPAVGCSGCWLDNGGKLRPKRPARKHNTKLENGDQIKIKIHISSHPCWPWCRLFDHRVNACHGLPWTTCLLPSEDCDQKSLHCTAYITANTTHKWLSHTFSSWIKSMMKKNVRLRHWSCVSIIHIMHVVKNMEYSLWHRLCTLSMLTVIPCQDVTTNSCINMYRTYVQNNVTTAHGCIRRH